MSKTLKIGVNSYINNLPLSCGFDKGLLNLDYQMYLDYPAYLTKKCEEGFFDISSISFWAYKSLEKNYKLLPNFGICANGQIKSVKIFANCPIEDFSKKKIFITDQSGSSSRAFIYYSKEILKFNPNDNRVYHMQEADVVFVIGDTALKFDNSLYIYSYDFGSLFAQAFKVPLLYGAIVVKRDIYDEYESVLVDFFDKSLSLFNANRQKYFDLALKSINRANLDEDFMEDYFSRMQYKISDNSYNESLKFLNNYTND